MKKWIIILLTGLLIGSGSGIVTSAPGQTAVHRQATFSQLTITSDGEHSSLSLQGADTLLLQPNTYIIPTRIETFTFPLGTSIESVTCIPRTLHQETLTKELLVAPDPVPLDGHADSTVIEQTTPPTAIHTWFTYQTGAGIEGEHTWQTVLKVQLFPVQYYPREHVLEWTDAIDITICYREPTSPFTFDQEYRLLILSPNIFHHDLERLLSHKNSKGMTTKLVGLDEIYNSTYFPVNGRDSEEQIKNFVYNAVMYWGTSFVLLVGDENLIPARYSHMNSGDGDGVFVSDLYYADLFNADGSFSSWDTNHNDIFGEFDWNGMTDDLDIYPDVYLGRLACHNSSQVNTCIDKIISYETNQSYTQEWFNHIVTIGGDTFPGDQWSIDEGEFQCQAVLNIMSDFTSSNIWASTGGLNGYPTGINNINNAINEGAGFVYFAGHGSWSSYATHRHNSQSWVPPGQYTTNSILSLVNGEKLPIAIPSACSIGQFNGHQTSFSWSFVENPNGGAVASFGASSIAWGYLGIYATYGLNGGLTVDMFEVYKNESAQTVGEMWGRAITQYIYPMMNDVLDYKTLEQWQPFCDPSLRIRDEMSQPPVQPLSPEGPSYGVVNNHYSFSASTTDPDDDVLYYYFDWGNTEFSTIGPYPSQETAMIDYMWTAGGDYQVRVRARDSHGDFSPWSDPLSVHIASPQLDVTMRCGNGVNILIKNTGDYMASNLTCSIQVIGGIMSKLNQNWTRTITKIDPNTQTRISTGFFFGFGYITLTVTMACSEEIPIATIHAEGTQMLFFTILYRH